MLAAGGAGVFGLCGALAAAWHGLTSVSLGAAVAAQHMHAAAASLALVARLDMAMLMGAVLLAAATWKYWKPDSRDAPRARRALVVVATLVALAASLAWWRDPLGAGHGSPAYIAPALMHPRAVPFLVAAIVASVLVGIAVVADAARADGAPADAMSAPNDGREASDGAGLAGPDALWWLAAGGCMIAFAFTTSWRIATGGPPWTRDLWALALLGAAAVTAMVAATRRSRRERFERHDGRWRWPRRVATTGAALAVVGLSVEALAPIERVDVMTQEPTTLRDTFGREWTFENQGLSTAQNESYASVALGLAVRRGEGPATVVAPEQRSYPLEDGSEPWPPVHIRAVVGDALLHYRILAVRSGAGGAELSVQSVPIPGLLWLATALVAAGCCVMAVRPGAEAPERA